MEERVQYYTEKSIQRQPNFLEKAHNASKITCLDYYDKKICCIAPTEMIHLRKV